MIWIDTIAVLSFRNPHCCTKSLRFSQRVQILCRFTDLIRGRFRLRLYIDTYLILTFFSAKYMEEKIRMYLYSTFKSMFAVIKYFIIEIFENLRYVMSSYFRDIKIDLLITKHRSKFNPYSTLLNKI